MNSNILKAISDETRFKMISIIKKGEICACELPKLVKKTQPAVSQHLKVLMQAELVTMRKDGAKRLYSISRKGKKILRDVERW